MRTFAFHVREKRQKWLSLAVFILGLFSLGLIAGRIFSAPRRKKPSKLGFALVLCLSGLARIGEGALLQKNPIPKYAAKLDVSAPTVGSLARVHWSLHGAQVPERRSANLSVSITHLEKDAVVFAVTGIPVAGEFSFGYQFTDGTDHRISAIALTQDGEPVRQEQVVSVSPVPPPLKTQLPTLAVFITAIFLGLLAGRWSRREWGAVSRH